MVPENPFDIKVAERIIGDLYRKRLRFISFLSERLWVLWGWFNGQCGNRTNYI